MTAAEDLAHNARLWDLLNEQFVAEHGLRAWPRQDIVWGLLESPESDLGAVGDVRGSDVLEIGCGTAYFAAWLARRGARVVALDLSAAQLATAAAGQQRYGPEFPLVRGNGEELPLRDASFDLVVSEHGAPAWCEPQKWVSEAARVLRAGGRLVFMTNSPLSAMCVPSGGGPAGDRLQRGPADVRTVTWPGGGVEHHPSHGDWIAHLLAAGLVVRRLTELRLDGDSSRSPGQALTDYQIVDRSWAMRWPVEDLWVAQKPLLPDSQARAVP